MVKTIRYDVVPDTSTVFVHLFLDDISGMDPSYATCLAFLILDFVYESHGKEGKAILKAALEEFLSQERKSGTWKNGLFYPEKSHLLKGLERNN